MGAEFAEFAADAFGCSALVAFECAEKLFPDPAFAFVAADGDGPEVEGAATRVSLEAAADAFFGSAAAEAGVTVDCLLAAPNGGGCCLSLSFESAACIFWMSELTDAPALRESGVIDFVADRVSGAACAWDCVPFAVVEPFALTVAFA